MFSLPFSASSHVWDEFELDGIVKVGEHGLVIEYEGSWTRYDDDAKVAGVSEWKATTLEIPWRDIASVTLERTWVRTSFIALRTSTIAAFDGFPLAKGVLAEIPVTRTNRAEASDLVAEVTMRLADASLRAPDGVRATADVPPVPAPALAPASRD